MSEVVYAQGHAASHSWALRGPRILTDPAVARATWERRLRTGLQALGKAIKGEAQAVYSDVPPIREGFAYETQLSPYPRMRLINRAALFPVVEYPTRPHVITAKNRPYLVFMGREGHLIRVKSVQHPGTKGRHAIDPIFARYDPQFAALLDAAAREMLAV